MSRRFTPAIRLAKSGPPRSEREKASEGGIIPKFLRFFSTTLSYDTVNDSRGQVASSGSSQPRHVGRLSSAIARQLGEWEEEERELKEQRYRDLDAAFHLYDVDRSGSISSRELRAILRSLGHNPTNNQILQLLAEVDVDGNGNLDMAEFLRLMDEFFNFSACDPKSELLPVFLLLTRRHDLDSEARVRIGDVRKMISDFNMDEKWTQGDTESLLENYPDDDHVNFEEFVYMVTGRK